MTSFDLNPRRLAVVVFVVLSLFYWVTEPGDRFESIDGYDYAQAAEIVPLHLVHDSRSILFHKLNRVLYVAAQALRLPLDGHAVIRLQCILAAAASVPLLQYILRAHYGVATPAAWAAGATLAVSFGFWRYAAEAEVYTPSALLILCTLLLVLRALDSPTFSPARFAWAGALGALSCLYYQGNALALCVAMPLLLIGRGRWQALLAYGAAGTIVSVIGIVLVFVASEGLPITATRLQAFVGMRLVEFDVRKLVASPLTGATFCLTHVFASLNWLYALHFVLDYLTTRVPGHLLRQEGISHAALAFRPWSLMAIPTFIAVVGTALAVIVQAIRHRSWPTMQARHWFLVVWIVLTAVMNAQLASWEPEVWITLQPGIVMAFCIWVLEPVMKAGYARLVWALPATLLAHNALGGIMMFRDEKGVHYEKTRWLAAELRPQDVILINMADQRILNYLRYRIGARLLYSDGVTANFATIDERFHDERGPLDDMLAQIWAKGGRVLTVGDLTRPSLSLASRSGEAETRRTFALAKRLEGRTRLVHQGSAVAIYEVRP